MLIKNLYTVQQIEKTEDGFIANVHLNKDHEVFQAHFPGNPVMPGVCMIQMIQELVEKETAEKLFLTKSTNIKFKAIINPYLDPDLKLDMVILREEGTFRVKNITTFADTVALELNAFFKIIA